MVVETSSCRVEHPPHIDDRVASSEALEITSANHFGLGVDELTQECNREHIIRVERARVSPDDEGHVDEEASNNANTAPVVSASIENAPTPGMGVPSIIALAPSSFALAVDFARSSTRK